MAFHDDLAPNLRSMLIGVAESPPERRERFIEPVARHGRVAIDAVIEWVYDRDLASFAFEVIARAAEAGAMDAAVAALAEVERRQLDPGRFATLVRTSDWITSLPRRTRAKPGGRAKRGSATPAIRPLPLRQLVAGELYSRRYEIHRSGLGADIFKGISYARDGEHVLLFSGGHGAAEFGYRDGWQGDVFRYFGEWRGEGDMRLTAGNAAILSRSPHIFVFTAGEPRG